MENKETDIKRLFDEAKKDSAWMERVKNAKTLAEYLSLYHEKNIKVSSEEKEKLAAMLENRQGVLGDEELEAVTGGYIPIFDECLQRYNRNRCFDGSILDLFSGCPNCKLVEIRKEGTWNRCILSCSKGYFTNIEGPPTRGELVR